jgi:hypothetical protein
MKYYILFTIMLIDTLAFGQNGIYISQRFEFVSQNEPFRNREDFTAKTLIIKINEFHGEFLNGSILWELDEVDGQSVYLEYELLSLKNSSFDEDKNLFIKCYNANIKALDQIIDKVELFIIKDVGRNTYRIDVFDPINLTINRFDNLRKI